MKSKILLGLSIFSSILVILHQFSLWSIVEITTIFFAPFIRLFVFGFFLVITIITIIVLFKYKIRAPIIIQLVTILMLFFFPFTQVSVNINFKMNKQEREKIVSMVEDGSLTSNVSDNPNLIKLPKEFEHLSRDGGEIRIEGNAILFYTVRGLLDEFSGIVYSPTDQNPVQDAFGGDFIEIIKLDTNWYFVVTG
jgi:hypothetical protein